MTIPDNFNEVKKQLPDTATLIAVSKKQPDDRIQAALDYGQRVFGENRVQEAHERWAERKENYPDLKLHLIGPLQSNKVKEAVSLFDVIHTIDRAKIAKTLDKEMKTQGKNIPCFIQVNTGEEEQKSGILPLELDEFYQFCQQETDLKIIGLMCIPPLEEPSAHHFALLKKYAEKLGLAALSMGMSNDYEKALRLGATHIRLGSALFGERPTTPA